MVEIFIFWIYKFKKILSTIFNEHVHIFGIIITNYKKLETHLKKYIAL